MAAPAAAVVVQAVAEVDLAHLAVLAPAQVVALRARRVHRVPLPLLARLLLLAKAHLPVPALVQVVVGLAHRGVEPAVLLDLLSRHSRQLFSAAMARSTPSPRATYAPVPRSR